MKKIFQILIIVSVGLLMNSCYYDELVERPGIPTDPEDPDYVEVKYEDDIQLIWNNNNCMECHNDTNRDPDLREGYSYNALITGNYVIPEDADNSQLYKILDDGHRNLTNDELVLIQGWINQGAENN